MTDRAKENGGDPEGEEPLELLDHHLRGLRKELHAARAKGKLTPGEIDAAKGCLDAIGGVRDEIERRRGATPLPGEGRA